MVELVVLGISLQEESSSPILLLHPIGSRHILPMGIGPMEAFAISTFLPGMENPAARIAGKSALDPQSPPGEAMPFPRPLTHDLLSSVIKTLGAIMTSLDIMTVINGAFIARAVLRRDGREYFVDCRPSDGVALAMRCDAVIRATPAVLQHCEDMATVMAVLPEHVRALASAKLAHLASLHENRRKTRISAALEDALASRFGDSPPPELISVARQMMEEDEKQGGHFPELDALLDDAQEKAVRRIRVDAPQTPRERSLKSPVVKVTGATINPPQIRVALVRQKAGEMPVIKGSLNTPGQDFSTEELTAMGLTPREAQAIMAAPDQDRWAMLLRLLAPETKVPM